MPEHRILDPANVRDQADLERLRSDPGLSITDTTVEQTASLANLLPLPSGGILDERPVWVYYPWRNALVRILGPRGFRLLRLDRNRNKITVDEQRAASSLTIGVVGLSVGHAVAHTLALEGLCGELRLADFDELDLSNLNRVPASLFDLGINKSIVAARRIAELDPYLTVTTFTDGIAADTIDHFLDGLDILVEECDSIDAKVMLRDHARRRGIPVIMETSDGGVLDVERFDLTPTRPILHGLLGDMNYATLSGLEPADKIPLASRILDPTKITARMLASLPDIGTTLSTWPQLGSDVMLGGASVAAVVRAFSLGRAPESGRTRIDLDALIASSEDPYAGPIA